MHAAFEAGLGTKFQQAGLVVVLHAKRVTANDQEVTVRYGGGELACHLQECVLPFPGSGSADHANNRSIEGEAGRIADFSPVVSCVLGRVEVRKVDSVVED